MTTASSNNSFIRNGELYILPTLTSDVIGREGVFDRHTFNLTGCTNTNLTACGAVSNPLNELRLTFFLSLPLGTGFVSSLHLDLVLQAGLSPSLSVFYL
jgi:hypothetical protein